MFKVTARIKKIWTIEFELISAVLCDQEVTDFKLYKKKTKNLQTAIVTKMLNAYF